MIYWMAVKGRLIREETEKHVECAASFLHSSLIAVTLVGQRYHLADSTASIIVATVIALSGI